MNKTSKKSAGLLSPDSSTGMGIITERVVSKVLGDCINCNEDKFNSPYDLISEKYGTINVKSSKIYKLKTGSCWRFVKYAQRQIPDYYFCIGLNDKMTEIVHVWAIKGDSEILRDGNININDDGFNTIGSNDIEFDVLPYNKVFQDIDVTSCKEFSNFMAGEIAPIENKTSIPVDKNTRDRLRTFGYRNESWVHLINRILDEREESKISSDKHSTIKTYNPNGSIMQKTKPVQIWTSVYDRLETRKKHPRQAFSEVIEKLLDETEEGK